MHLCALAFHRHHHSTPGVRSKYTTLSVLEHWEPIDPTTDVLTTVFSGNLQFSQAQFINLELHMNTYRKHILPWMVPSTIDSNGRVHIFYSMKDSLRCLAMKEGSWNVLMVQEEIPLNSNRCVWESIYYFEGGWCQTSGETQSRQFNIMWIRWRFCGGVHT